MECSVHFYRGPWTIALSVQFAFRPTQLGMSFFSVVRKLNTYLKGTRIGLKSFIMDLNTNTYVFKKRNFFIRYVKETNWRISIKIAGGMFQQK